MVTATVTIGAMHHGTQLGCSFGRGNLSMERSSQIIAQLKSGNSTVDGYFGCLDIDGDGIADIYDEDVGNNSGTPSNETNQTGPVDSDNDGVDDLYDICPETVAFGIVDIDGCLIDEDGDGVDDFKDDCLGTTSGATVDANGCAVTVDEPRSFFESFSSGERGARLSKRLVLSAIIVALFGFLQTNLAAALLPDSIRWIRVLRATGPNSTKRKYGNWSI